MTSRGIQVIDGVLFIADREIAIELPVAQAVQADEKVIARLDVPNGVVRNDNVICFDLSGNALWTIQESQHGGTEDNPYADINIDHGKVVAETFNGVQYEINLDNGLVSAIGFRRF